MDAVSMTEKLLREFNFKIGGVRLRAGRKGSFEFSINGRLLYSKLEKGRHPAYKELREPVQAELTGPSAS